MQIIARIILLLLFVAVLVFLGNQGGGHVIIFIASYRLDITLLSFIIILLLLFVLSYYTIKLLNVTFSLPQTFKKLRTDYRNRQATKLLQLGLIDYFGGNFKSSHNRTLAALKQNQTTAGALAWLIAYKSATNLPDSAAIQQQYLAKLDLFADKEIQLATNLAITEYNYQQQLYAKANDSLALVIEQDKKNSVAHWWWLKVYRKLKNYDKAFEELLWLSQHANLPPHNIVDYKLEIIEQLFLRVSDYAELQFFYKKLTTTDKEQPLIQQFYCAALLRLGCIDQLLALLAKLNTIPFNLLELILSLAKLTHTQDQIEKVVAILQPLRTDLANSHLYHLALGIAKYRLKDYLAARSSLEESLNYSYSNDALLYLLFVADSIGDGILRKATEDKLLAQLSFQTA